MWKLVSYASSRLAVMFALSACASYVEVTAPLRPLPMEPAGEIRTAQINDVVLAQKFLPLRTIRLTAPISQAAGDGIARFELPEGEALYEVIGPDLDGFVYCSVGKPYKGVNALMYRACLGDTDNDRSFDMVHILRETNEDYDISGGTLRNGAPLLAAAPYEILDVNEEGLHQYLGLRVFRSFGRYDLDIVAVTNGKVVRVDSEPIRIGESRQLPRVAGTGGARVLVLGVQAEQVTYRVLSGFDPSVTYELVYTFVKDDL